MPNAKCRSALTGAERVTVNALCGQAQLPRQPRQAIDLPVQAKAASAPHSKGQAAAEAFFSLAGRRETRQPLECGVLTPLWLGQRGPKRNTISRNWGVKNDAAFPLSPDCGRGILVRMIKSRVKASPSFLDRLKTALISALAANDIIAKVRTERVPTTKLYRVAVMAPKFKALKHSERQNLVWRIADSALSPEEQLHISMILTLTPDEVEEC